MSPRSASNATADPACPGGRPSAPSQRYPVLSRLIAYLDSLTGRADLEVLARLLGELKISREDLKPACTFCEDAYRRNIISEAAWYELVCICWHSGQRTPIHDHQGSSCAFRVVEGTGMECRFEKTPSGLICPVDTHPLKPGAICASYDDDVHQVANAQPPGTDLVTLHIYSPPLRNYRRYTLDSATCTGQVEERSMRTVSPGV